MANAGARRITVETVAAGQPRPYADSMHHVRVFFEYVPWNDNGGDFQPNFISEASARERLRGQYGFTERKRGDEDCDWFSTRLDWIKPIDAKSAADVIPLGNPNQVVAATWEFHTTTPFTD